MSVRVLYTTITTVNYRLVLRTTVARAPRHVSIDSREGVVQDIYVRVRISRPGYRNPLLLSAGKVDALFPNLGHVAGGKLG